MLATACHYTYPQIDAMTMSDFEELSQYWRDHPPPHILLAGYVGYKPTKTSTAPSNDLAALLGADPVKGGTMRLQ